MLYSIMTIATRQPGTHNLSSDAVSRRVVLRAEGLMKSFDGQSVLNDVSLTLRQGEVVLLRGENGSGKTTLLNILTGNLEPDKGTIYYSAAGDLTVRNFPRPWLSGLNPRGQFTPEFVSGRGLGRTWQDIRLFRSQTLRENIAIAHQQNRGQSPLFALLKPRDAQRRSAEINRQADDMLSRMGLEARSNSSADMISLGQSKRVAIARTVAAGAQILLLDEPLAGLDRDGIDDVVAMLEELLVRDSLTLVIVEHAFSQPELHGLVTSEWFLSEGCLSASNVARDRRGARPTARSEASQPKRHDLLAWAPLLSTPGTETVRQNLPRGAILTKISPTGGINTIGPAAIDIQHLVVNRGARIALGLDDQGQASGFSLTLNQGEVAILQAPNGWGKSTLFETICGTLTASTGSIKLMGAAVGNLSPWRRKKLGLTACPSGARLFHSFTLDEMRQIAGLTTDCLRDLTHLTKKSVSDMSGGERQRLALAIAIEASRGQPGLLILDEPFAMLDQPSVHAVIEKLLRPSQALLILIPAAN